MNKFKKLVAVLVSVVMACGFATGVFAADYVDDLSAARAEVNGYLTSSGVYGMDGVVNSLNIDVVVSGSEVAVVPTASANGVSGTTQWKYATDGSVASASNPLTASSSSVIKATGDNSAMVIATIVLSVVGVLGLAVRKESALAL